MKNGRCRMHGGLSTGPKTAEGIERIRAARTKHGRYSQASIAARREARQVIRTLRALLRMDPTQARKSWSRYCVRNAAADRRPSPH